MSYLLSENQFGAAPPPEPPPPPPSPDKSKQGAAVGSGISKIVRTIGEAIE